MWRVDVTKSSRSHRDFGPAPSSCRHGRRGFRPNEYGYEFEVIVTNKRMNPRKVVAFHEGRGSQEGVFAELKTHCQMDYVPVKTRVGNQPYLFSGILAHSSFGIR